MPNGIRHRPTFTSTPRTRTSSEAHILHRLQRCQKAANFSTAAVGFLLRLPAKALPMWPSVSLDNPKKIIHDVGPRSLQDEVEITSYRIDLPLCLAASSPPCSFNVACGGLVLRTAQSMSTMKPHRKGPSLCMTCYATPGSEPGAREAHRELIVAIRGLRVSRTGTWPARTLERF